MLEIHEPSAYQQAPCARPLLIYRLRRYSARCNGRTSLHSEWLHAHEPRISGEKQNTFFCVYFLVQFSCHQPLPKGFVLVFDIDFHTIIGKSTILFSISPAELSFKTYLEKCVMFVWCGMVTCCRRRYRCQSASEWNFYRRTLFCNLWAEKETILLW